MKQGTLESRVNGILSKIKSKAEAREGAKAKRNEAVIINDIRTVYCQLSPECLTCDGELSMEDVERQYKKLNSKLDVLFHELGRKMTEHEAFA
jgi:hypothetical protein